MSDLVSPLSNLRISDDTSGTFKPNFAALEEGSSAATMSSSDGGVIDPAPKKRGRPAKPKLLADGQVMMYPANEQEEITMLQSNVPYINTFSEPMALTRNAIVDLDKLNHTVTDQLDAVIDSKTLRNKYTYISDLSSTAASLISTKLKGISDISRIIGDAHKLDLQRSKELKLSNAADDANDDKRIMDMYSAYINTPVGSYGTSGPQFPSMTEMTMSGNGLMGIDMSGPMSTVGMSADPGYDNWKQNMSPETNRMIMNKMNPNVQTVVVYDQTTNNKFFDVIDRTTGQSVPNMPRPDSFLLSDTYPNLNNGTARNSNIDTVYPLVLVGQPASLDEF